MGKTLSLARDLHLPLAIASQAVCLVGVRGSGKTNTAGVMAEELLDHQQPIVVLDPTDAWYGLRSSRDGKGAGYPVYVFGGPHGDLDLQETAGREIAEFVATTRVSVILSLRHLRKGAQRRFVTDFCEELFHLKGRPELRSPLTVFVDEAPLFVPQKVLGELARTVSAVEDLIARGRNAGFGVVLISQRMATINKDVTTQCDTVVCHRVPGPQDRKAIAEWFEANASVEDLKRILGSLATLRNGEAWVWAPLLGIIQRTQIRLRRTFDSSSTPQGQPAVPRVLAPVDIEQLRQRLAAAVERAKADDPKALRRRIAELEGDLSRVQATPPPARGLSEGDRRLMTALHDQCIATMEELGTAENAILERVERMVRETLDAAIRSTRDAVAYERERFHAGLRASGADRLLPRLAEPARVPPAPVAPAPRPAAPAADRRPVEARILGALAELEQLGAREPRRELTACLAGYENVRSKGFANAIGALRTAGLIEYPSAGTIRLTPEGRSKAEYPARPRTAADVQERVITLLGGVSERILRPLIAAYPRALARDAVAAAAGYENVRSKGFANAIGRLRSLGFIDYPKTGEVQAASLLFLGA